MENNSTSQPEPSTSYRYEGLAGVVRPLGWRSSSPQPTMRQTRRHVSRVEHLQRRQESITLKRLDREGCTIWQLVENPTWMLTYNEASRTYLAIIGSSVTMLGRGESTPHFESIRRQFVQLVSDAR